MKSIGERWFQIKCLIKTKIMKRFGAFSFNYMSLVSSLTKILSLSPPFSALVVSLQVSASRLIDYSVTCQPGGGVKLRSFWLWSNSANHLTAVLSTPKYNLSNKYLLHRLIRSIYQTIIHCRCVFLLAMIITKHLIDFVMIPVSQQQSKRHAGPPCRCCSTSRGRLYI